MKTRSSVWNRVLILLVIATIVIVTVASGISREVSTKKSASIETASTSRSTRSQLAVIPSYSGAPAVAINNNKPYFKTDVTKVFERYSPLDTLGRCGQAEAVIGRESMPTQPRGKIGMIKPTGWHTVRYDDLIPDGKYLYNRCHLIGYQITGQNANPKNLITGTRYLNVEGMEPFENATAQYIRKTGNHVHYRVTPIFKNNDLVARGVVIEAKSVEDNGRGICFCVYCFNVQPGIKINYKNGNSERSL